MSNSVDNFLNSAGKAVEVFPDLYEDLLQPAVKETGKFIARIPSAINAALIGVDCWVEEKKYKLDETKKLLEHKLENVDPDKIVAPEPYVAIPALQAISYSMNCEELRNMYANLLANSMNIDTKDSVHPNFVNTIRSMSPRDVSNLASFKDSKSAPLARYNLRLGDNSFTTMNPYVFLFNSKYTDTPEQAVSISLLISLGVVEANLSFKLNGESYSEFYETEEYIHLTTSLNTNTTLNGSTYIPPNFVELLEKRYIEVQKGSLSLTPFGEKLKKLCD